MSEQESLTGFSKKAERAIIVAVVVMGVLLLGGGGAVAYFGYKKYMHPPSHARFQAPIVQAAATPESKPEPKKDEDEATFGSVLMVPRQGDEVVHSAVALPSGNLAVVMFPGFTNSKPKKDSENSADGGRIIIWNPSKGHIVEEMRITSAPPPIQR